MTISRALAVGILASALASPSWADTVTYNSLATFNAAVSSTTLQDFSGASSQFNLSTPVSLGSGLSVAAYGTLNSAYIFGGDNLGFTTTNSSGGIEFLFSPGVTAFGVDVTDLGTIGATTLAYGLQNGDAGNFVVNYTGSGGTFFTGLTSDAAFAWIKISNSQDGDVVFLDNIRYGAAAAVPEPSSVVVALGSAVGGLGFWTIRRRRSAA